jgi:hypothetical protein
MSLASKKTPTVSKKVSPKLMDPQALKKSGAIMAAMVFDFRGEIVGMNRLITVFSVLRPPAHIDTAMRVKNDI